VFIFLVSYLFPFNFPSLSTDVEYYKQNSAYFSDTECIYEFTLRHIIQNFNFVIRGCEKFQSELMCSRQTELNQKLN
jgi:hypothetical protein